MFGLSTTEVLIILAVALIVLGPQQLPKIAAQLGKGMRDLQRAANDFKRDMAESAKDLPNLRDIAKDVTSDAPPRPTAPKNDVASIVAPQTADAPTQGGLPPDPYLARNRERFGTSDAERPDPYADLAKANREPLPPPLSNGESNPIATDDRDPKHLGEFDSAGYPTDADEAAADAEGYPPDDEPEHTPVVAAAPPATPAAQPPTPAALPNRASATAAPALPTLKPADGAVAFGSPAPAAPDLPSPKS
ncbi:MAG: twin-arginine translocase TatA/TatE family subunit [Myxococcales bacterium]|nr:twin-arginine translocase TatA/TatE family subunit [Myxococcales bacterium]